MDAAEKVTPPGTIETVEPVCGVCGRSGSNRPYRAREMMFGLREEFPYFQCSYCNTLQIKEAPADMSGYYRRDYYSFAPPPRVGPVRRAFRKFKDRRTVFASGPLGGLVHRWLPNKKLRSLARIPLGMDSRILDVGCGAGHVLLRLRECGFRNLLGIDPLIERDVAYENGVRVLKSTIHEAAGEWDLVMFHHSLEHMPDPVEAVRSAAGLLAPGGVCLVRTPTVSSHAWERYGTDWVQLDAPRHLFLFSVEAMAVLAQRAGLRLREFRSESTQFQFWGSEQYLRDIPLTDRRSYRVSRSGSIFTRREIRRFRRDSARLNRAGRGDQAAFYLEGK
jgi:2-polyprenyl-3-methyl-5-hydroxy-6-metoxy-1,4-benzoquinol methylase